MKSKKPKANKKRNNKAQIIEESIENSECNTTRARKGSDDSSNKFGAKEKKSQEIQFEVESIIKHIEQKKKFSNLFRIKRENSHELFSENTLIDLFQKKEKEIFSLISLNKENEKNKSQTEIEKRITENGILKDKFDNLFNPMKNAIKNVENIRKIEDEMIKRKREREDKDLFEKRKRLDDSIKKVNLKILDVFENIAKNVAYIRKIEDDYI